MKIIINLREYSTVTTRNCTQVQYKVQYKVQSDQQYCSSGNSPVVYCTPGEEEAGEGGSGHINSRPR